MSAAASEFGFPDAQTCIRWLLTTPVTPRHIQILARYLTVGETYFFREKPALTALEESILPELIRARRSTTRKLRIWSAACCTGEEPYTIAIILSRLLPDWKDWDIKILGTDINTHFLSLATTGVYRNWSFRTTSEELKARYFTATLEGYAVVPEIKQMVTFDYLNLADTRYSSPFDAVGGMDVIFCRNALMYFSPAGVAHAVANFHKALSVGGWLIVNPTEATPALFAQYEVISRPDVTLFRKGHPNYVLDSPVPVVHEVAGYERSGNPQPATRNPQTPVVARAGQTPGTRNPVVSSISQSTMPRRLTTLDNSQIGKDALTVSQWEAAQTLQKQGRYLEAREKLLSLVSENDGDAPVFALLAGLEAHLGQLDAALQWSARATQADSLNAAYWYVRATLLQEQGAVSEVITTLKRVLYLDINFVLAHFVLGNIFLQQQRGPESLKHFNTARSQLRNYQPGDILPGSEDLTAGQLDSIIAAILSGAIEGTV